MAIVGISKSFFFVILAISFQTESCTALHARVTPQTFNEVVTDELTISCHEDGSTPMLKQVVMLELWKREQSPLVIVREDEITSGPGIKGNMKAKGHIEKTGNNTYLQLSIKNPKIEDAGTYSCVIFYLNELYQLKELKVYSTAQVTVNETDITDIAAYLMGKLSTLEKTTLQQGDVIAKQKAVIEGQDSTLKSQEEDLTELSNMLKKQGEAVNSCKTKIASIEKSLMTGSEKMDDQEEKLKQQNETIMEQDRKIQSQEMELAEQKNTLKQQEANAKFASAFSYRYNGRNTFSNGQAIIFSDRIMDMGNDYSVTTGKFTAPKTGLYGFDLIARMRTTNVYMFIDLKAKGSTVVSLYSYAYQVHKSASMSTVVSLNAGEQVWPVSRGLSSGNTIYAGFESVFSGYLIKLQ